MFQRRQEESAVVEAQDTPVADVETEVWDGEGEPGFANEAERYDDEGLVQPVVTTELAQSDAEGDESTLSIDNTVVEKIVAITCRSVDGILQMKGNLISSIQEGFGGTDVTKGVSVEMVGEDACNVNVSIIMEYGKSAPKIFRELRDKISEKITDMTGLKVKSVNVRITNVMTREEIEGGRRRERADAPEQKTTTA